MNPDSDKAVEFVANLFRDNPWLSEEILKRPMINWITKAMSESNKSCLYTEPKKCGTEEVNLYLERLAANKTACNG